MVLNAWLCRIQIQRLGIPFDDLDDLAIKVNRTTVKEVVVTKHSKEFVLQAISQQLSCPTLRESYHNNPTTLQINRTQIIKLSKFFFETQEFARKRFEVSRVSRHIYTILLQSPLTTTRKD